ncbi:hypothetical protein V5740_03170 [Croceibacterium sp. TMG7-5b_MA50]|uniref:hypothetical protein n=1 Tax=Croceibacterium sp. TMG7-5b_MA50 TaxID=3121290 RepID=UPI0032214425
MNSPLLLVAPIAALLMPSAAHRDTALDQAIGDQPARQVRIEQRVIIRIAPGAAQQRAMPRRLTQQPAGDCVPVAAISGVEPTRDNRLLLVMRDRSLLTAELSDGCAADHYYAGFYMERSNDGQICVRRDHLHARDGSDCRVTSFHQLVSVAD